MGVIAQDIEKILPYIVETGENGVKSVNYTNLIGLLIEGVKDLEKKNSELENKINILYQHLNL